MIAVDTSTLIAFLAGEEGSDIGLLENILQDKQMVLPPVVLSELLSDPKLDRNFSKFLSDLPLLEIGVAYWERVGALRAKMLQRRHKARLADTMIAQSCLDHGVPLLTRDKDFRSFSKYTSLKLLPH